MKSKRRLAFCCSQPEAGILGKILRTYAHTAFPPGGSACATNSRNILLDYAEAAERGQLELGSRQFPMIKAAIRWYFDEIEKGSKSSEMLINCFEKRNYPHNRP